MRTTLLFAMLAATYAGTASAQEIQLTGPLRATTTCGMHAREGRLEIAATTGIVDRGGGLFAVGTRMQYFVVDAVGLGVWTLAMPGVDSSRVEPTTMTVSQTTLVPIDGKLRFFGDWYTRVAIYARGGVGGARIHDRTYFVSGVGAGVSIEATKWLTFDLAYDAFGVPAIDRMVLPIASLSVSFWLPHTRTYCDGSEHEDVVIALSRGVRRC